MTFITTINQYCYVTNRYHIYIYIYIYIYMYIHHMHVLKN